MSSCPNCHKQIEIKEEHFGTLYQCSFCKSEFFVDFSGTPENSKEPLATEPELASQEPNISPLNNEIAPPIDESQLASPYIQESNENMVAPAEYQPLVNPLESMNTFPEPAGEGFSEIVSEVSSIPDNFSSVPESVEKFEGGVFFNDVADFGNEVQNHTGVLNFDIVIDEIDLPEQKMLLLEHLEDKRFGLILKK